MTIKRMIVLTLVLLVFLTLTVACNDYDGWDGMDRTSEEYTGVQTRQAGGLLLDTPTPMAVESE